MRMVLKSSRCHLEKMSFVDPGRRHGSTLSAEVMDFSQARIGGPMLSRNALHGSSNSFVQSPR